MRAGLPTTLRVAPEDQLPRLLPIHWMQNIMLPTEPLYLVDGMIPRAGLSFIYGPPGSGKSFLLCIWLRALRSGGSGSVARVSAARFLCWRSKAQRVSARVWSLRRCSITSWATRLSH